SSTPLNSFFLFNDTATTEIYTLSLHDALPIWRPPRGGGLRRRQVRQVGPRGGWGGGHAWQDGSVGWCCLRAMTGRASVGRCGERSEEHTSELQSRSDLVCRLLLEKKKTKEVD